jgi:hypothetical protein
VAKFLRHSALGHESIGARRSWAGGFRHEVTVAELLGHEVIGDASSEAASSGAASSEAGEVIGAKFLGHPAQRFLRSQFKSQRSP